MQDSDSIVRERAAGTLEYVTVKDVGARDMIQHGGVPELVKLLDDEVQPVRAAAYKALIEAGRFDSTRRALVAEQSALPLLMQLVLDEDPGLAVKGLVLLNACVQVSGRGPASGWHTCEYEVH